MGKDVPVSIRVNPEIDAKTHPYITTGLRKNKFGILWPEARRLYREIKETEHLVPVGISSHIGSQIVEIPPFVAAIRSLRQMVSELAAERLALKYIDIGGGLGITYRNEAAAPSHRICEGHRGRLEGTGLTLDTRAGQGHSRKQRYFRDKTALCQDHG